MATPPISIYGPLVWQRLSVINQLLNNSGESPEKTRLNLELGASGILSFKRWQNNQKIGFEFRILLSDVMTVVCDYESKSVVLNGNSEDSVQSLYFSQQDKEWEGDYAFSSGDVDSIWIGPFISDDAVNVMHKEATQLLDFAQTPTKYFAELPSHWP